MLNDADSADVLTHLFEPLTRIGDPTLNEALYDVLSDAEMPPSERLFVFLEFFETYVENNSKSQIATNLSKIGERTDARLEDVRLVFPATADRSGADEESISLFDLVPALDHGSVLEIVGALREVRNDIKITHRMAHDLNGRDFPGPERGGPGGGFSR